MKTLILVTLLYSTSVFASVGNPSDFLDWADQFYAANRHSAADTFAELAGQTPDGRPCKLAVYKKDYDGTHREYYISLGTSSNGGTGEDDFNYIGTDIFEGPYFPSPSIQMKDLEVTPQYVRVHVVQDESDGRGGGFANVENDLVVRMNAQGRATQAQGSSSHWPSSTCTF